MRISLRLLNASPTAAGTKLGFGPPPLALLPPIPLYRRVLRANRKCLPRQMRLLGDEYVKSEFRAHRNVENPVHIVSGIPLLLWFSPESFRMPFWRVVFHWVHNWLMKA